VSLATGSGIFAIEAIAAVVNIRGGVLALLFWDDQQ
jgi:hypothetical protein